MNQPHQREPITPTPGLPVATWRQAYRAAQQLAHLTRQRTRVVGAPVANAPGRWAYVLEHTTALTVNRLGNVPVRRTA